PFAIEPRRGARQGAPEREALIGGKASLGVRRPRGDLRSSVAGAQDGNAGHRSEEHTSELQSLTNLVCRLLLEKKKQITHKRITLCTVSEPRRFAIFVRGHRITTYIRLRDYMGSMQTLAHNSSRSMLFVRRDHP